MGAPATALAIIESEFDGLPVVDDRHRLWPWSLRSLAQRRGCSPGTVHKHLQALRAAEILVADPERPGRTLVDVDRLRGHTQLPTRLLAAADRRPSPSTTYDTSTAEQLLRAIDALAEVVEARADLADAVAPVIERLARILSTADEARDRAPDALAKPRDRAPFSRERKRDLSRSSISLPTNGARLARCPEARDEPTVHRTPDGLMGLLAPLDPTQHVTYTEGVLTALAPYTDDQVTHAVARVAAAPATNPIGLLVDRAKKADPIYFPTTIRAPLPLELISRRRHDEHCLCAGRGTLALDMAGNSAEHNDPHAIYAPCPGRADVSDRP